MPATPKTGANVGPVLTSIALTNTPFVEGMAPLVAASRYFEPPMVTKRVINVSVSGIHPRSPLARAVLAGLAARLSTPKGQQPQAEPPTAEERELARATKQQLARRRDERLPMKLDASNEVGRTATEKVITAMRNQVPGFVRLSWEEQFVRASEALRLGVARVQTEATR